MTRPSAGDKHQRRVFLLVYTWGGLVGEAFGSRDVYVRRRVPREITSRVSVVSTSTQINESGQEGGYKREVTSMAMGRKSRRLSMFRRGRRNKSPSAVQGFP